MSNSEGSSSDPGSETDTAAELCHQGSSERAPRAAASPAPLGWVCLWGPHPLSCSGLSDFVLEPHVAVPGRLLLNLAGLPHAALLPGTQAFWSAIKYPTSDSWSCAQSQLQDVCGSRSQNFDRNKAHPLSLNAREQHQQPSAVVKGEASFPPRHTTFQHLMNVRMLPSHFDYSREGGRSRVCRSRASSACNRPTNKPESHWVAKRDLQEQNPVLMGYNTNISHPSILTSRTHPLWPLFACAIILAVLTPEINPCISKQKLLTICNALLSMCLQSRDSD